jgi:hypothetical protein
MTSAPIRDPLAGQAGIGGADWLEKARSHLRKADLALARLVADRPDFDPRRWMTELLPMDLFGALLFQIVGQQLSVAATRRILERIEARFGGRLPSAADAVWRPPTCSRPHSRKLRYALSPQGIPPRSNPRWRSDRFGPGVPEGMAAGILRPFPPGRRGQMAVRPPSAAMTAPVM